MITAQEYVDSVVEQLPRGSRMREQIARELHGIIAERLAQGQALGDILRQLGDPEKLAESYLEAVPMESAGVGTRFGAKVIDYLVSLAILAPIVAVCFWILPRDAYTFAVYFPFYFVICMIAFLGGGVVLSIYGVVAEYTSGATIGKRAMGIRVVREKGTRITLGQSIVRHLPFVMQVIWVDALFALFTEHKQRAFELLSRTRVVLTSPEEAV